MKASETTVREILQGEKQYVIPLYQRRYSWERKDDKDLLNQLWDDIMLLDGNDRASTHFLGSVVIAPSPSNTPAGVVRWLVVDGQQRLTTLSLLLCAIRDHVQRDDPQLAHRVLRINVKFHRTSAGLIRNELMILEKSWRRRECTLMSGTEPFPSSA